MVPRSFLRQDDPTVVNVVEELYATTKMVCIVPRSFLRQDDPMVVNVVCRIVYQFKMVCMVSRNFLRTYDTFVKSVFFGLDLYLFTRRIFFIRHTSPAGDELF